MKKLMIVALTLAMAGPALAQGGGAPNGFGGQPSDGASVADSLARSTNSGNHMNGTHMNGADNANMPASQQGTGASTMTSPTPSSPNR